MIPYTPYTLAVSFTPYVLMLEVLLAALLAYLLVMIAYERKAVHLAAEQRSADRLLRSRLRHSSMMKLLQRIHVDPAAYLRWTPASEIQAQLDTCSSCTHRSLCDQALACKRAANVDLTFCPNLPLILTQVRSAA